MPTCFNYLAVDRSMSTFQFQVGMPMRWNNPEAFKACLCPKWPGGQLRSPLLGLWIYQAGWPCFSFNGDRPSCFCVRKEDGTTRSVSVDGSERIHRASPSLTEPHRASPSLTTPAGTSCCGTIRQGDLVISRGSMDHGSLEKRRNICRHALIIRMYI